VEEQFYILWPTIFIWLGSGKNSHRALLFLGAAVAIAPLFKMTWLNQLCPAFFSPLLSVNSFFSRYVSLAAGCFSAVLLARYYQSVAAYLKSRSWMIIILGISLINLTKFLDVWWVIRFGPLLQAIGFSLLLLQSVVAPEWCIYRPLNWGWVRQIGVLSYSIYIWQALFWSPPDWLGLGKIWWLGLWLPPLLIVAVLSYYGLERPLVRLRRQYHPG
jgi:peptidoglycan/LPS O-acetylase OafA/YrhL